MPSIACKCGSRLSFGEIPNPIEWLMISDDDFDTFPEKVDASEIYANVTHMLKCTNCNRLWIFWNGFQSAPTSYMPEGIIDHS
jgi:hypothetical protein